MEWIRGMGRAKVEMEFLRLSCGNSYLRSSVLCGGGPFDGTKYSIVLYYYLVQYLESTV